MQKYITFDNSPEIQAAIDGGLIDDLTPGKVYPVRQSLNDDTEIHFDDDVGFTITSIVNDDTPHLKKLGSFYYCDEDGNRLDKPKLQSDTPEYSYAFKLDLLGSPVVVQFKIVGDEITVIDLVSNGKTELVDGVFFTILEPICLEYHEEQQYINSTQPE